MVISLRNYVFFNFAEFCGIVAVVLRVPSLSDCAERRTNSA